MKPQQPSTASPFSGTERFAIEGEIGRGGMGVVYRARDRERGAVVALKTLVRTDPGGLYRFKREFRALADTSHPNLVALHELVAEDEQWFFTMELIDGVDFLSYLRGPGAAGSAAASAPSRTTRTGAFVTASGSAEQPPVETLDTRDGQGSNRDAEPPRRAAPVTDFDRLREALRGLVAGVCALHEAGHLHRDIKPSNVMVAREDGRVVLLDFGVITELAHKSVAEKELVGTPAYMAPEQVVGDAASESSDWYSVGVMLFEALTGERPFHGTASELLAAKRERDPPDPRDLCPIAGDLGELCVELLARDPAARPTDNELCERLGIAGGPAAVIDRATAMPLLIGREGHLAALDAALDRVRGGAAATVFVHGSTGMGKSWLVRSFLDGLSDEPTLVLRGRCYERESVPYKALDSLVDDLCRHLIGLDPETVADILPADIDALATAFPVLRRVEAVTAGRAPATVRDPLELRERAFAALRALFDQLARRQPLVLFIDDLQWGDADSAPLLSGLMRPPDPPPLLLLCAFRSEEMASGGLLAELRSAAGAATPVELPVGPLEFTEARLLARHLLVKAKLPSSSGVVAIARESGGCPYFVHELVHYAQSRAVSAPIPDQEVRLSLDEVICSRVDALPEAARRLLEAVAVAGRPLRQEVVERAAEVGASPRPVINQLRLAHLVHTTGSRSDDLVEVYHDRIRVAVVASLPAEVLAVRHRRLALALQSTGSSDNESMALHFAAAGDHERASEYAAHAAERAAAALAFERAAEMYRFALSHHRLDPAGERGLRAKLARALGNAGHGAEAARVYLDLVDGASAAEALDHRRNAAMHYLGGGHFDEGIATMRGVLHAVGLELTPGRTRTLLSVLYQRFRLWLRGLDFRRRDESQIAAAELCAIDACWATAVGLSMVDTIHGAAFIHRHTRMALAAGELLRVTRGLSAEVAIRSAAGPSARRQVERLIARARPLLDQVGSYENQAWFLTSVGFADYQIGRFRAARDTCQQALEIFRNECVEVYWIVATVQTHLAWDLFYLGELRALAEHVRDRLAEARRRGDLYTSVNLRVGLTNVVWLCADQPDLAQRHAEEALASWSREGFHLQHYWATLALVLCDLYRGDGAAATARIEAVWPDLERSLLLRLHLFGIEAWHLRGRALLAGADQPRSLRKIARIARRIAGQGRYGDGFAGLLQAGVATGQADPAAAISALSRAEENFAAADMALYAAAARRRRGELVGGEQGAELCAEADGWMAGQGIVNPARLASTFVPLARPL